jgi:hypothetical protein
LAQITRRPAWTDWLGSEIGLGNLNPNAFKVILICFAVLVAGLMGWLTTRHKKRLQALRNTEILLPGPKALFLRPYFSDKGIKLPNPFYSVWSTALSGISINAGFLGPEEFVGRVLEPFINVVQVGGNPATIGNATISTPEKDWKPLVIKAIGDASIIIILPVLREDNETARASSESTGKSTIEELGFLVDLKRMRKTIVIMPNAIWYRRRTIGKGWERARSKAAEFGVNLPAYENKGAVLIFEPIGGNWQVANSFGRRICARRKIAVGIVEAVMWLASREPFILLDR